MRPLEVILKHLASFVADWPGEAVGEGGLVHVLNGGGTRPPLVWCFNAGEEFPALAAALGPDQPVIGLRSLNVLVDVRKRARHLDIQVAGVYLDILRRHIGLSRCRWVGGNCQGASMAAELAALMVREGHPVGAFIAMEWVPLLPFPGACALVFGAESREYNPFLHGRNPWPLWRHMFGRAGCHIIPGGHGTYFAPDTVGNLAAVLRAVMAEPAAPVRRADEDDPLVAEPPPPRIGVGEPLCLGIARRCFDRPDSRLYAVWIPEVVAPYVQSLHKPLLSAGGPCVVLRAPAVPGRWSLHVFDCTDGRGPHDWHQQSGRQWSVEVTAPWAPVEGGAPVSRPGS